MVTHEPDIAAYAKRNVMMRDGVILNDHLVLQRADAGSQLQQRTRFHVLMLSTSQPTI